MNLSASVITVCLICLSCHVESTKYSSVFRTISHCSSTNRTETDWSQFDDIAVTIISQSSIISNLVVSHEESCITSCQEIALCITIQVNTTMSGGTLSLVPSTVNVMNQTGSKLLLKVMKNFYKVEEACDKMLGCHSLLFDGNVYFIMIDRHYTNKLDARRACLEMSNAAGEFGLAILDTWDKITAVQSYLSALPINNDIWLYIGGEAPGMGAEDPGNIWTRTGATIAGTLWYGIEPNSVGEQCLVITNDKEGLMDAQCSGQINGLDVYTLCEYFPG